DCAAPTCAAPDLAVLRYHARGDPAPGPGHSTHAGHGTGRPHGPAADDRTRPVPRGTPSQNRAAHGAFPPYQIRVGTGFYAYEASGEARGAPSGPRGIPCHIAARQLVPVQASGGPRGLPERCVCDPGGVRPRGTLSRV